jgi:hypothetical protein
MSHRIWILLLLGMGVSLQAFAQGYYLCQNPVTGKKTGQDFPCQSGKEVGTYAPVTPEELKAREETSRQSKREFERLRPGTYPPEEYMTEEELAAYRSKLKEREAERKRLEDELAIREASRRAAQAEQRAADAVRTAQEAKARATAAEEAAVQRRPQTILLAPRPLPNLRRDPPCNKTDPAKRCP